MDADVLRNIGLIALAWMGASLVVALILFIFVIRRLKRLNVPPNAGFGETLLYTPFLVVVFLDLLDWGLDVLAAPVAWAILGRLGLQGLRGVTVVEALIPFTQPIPTMTASWLWVRLFGHDYPPFNTREFPQEKQPK